MRKFTSRLLLLMTVLSMALSITSCVGRKSGSAQKEREEKTTENNKSEDKTEDDKKETDKNSLYQSVADYVNSDAMQAALDTMKSSLQEGIGIDLMAEGDNKLVYVFKYETIAHTEGDGMAEALEQAIAAQDATFQQTADSVKAFVGNDEVIVEIRYIDMNDAVIFSKTYVSQ